jgi:hypothetical protein
VVEQAIVTPDGSVALIVPLIREPRSSAPLAGVAEAMVGPVLSPAIGKVRVCALSGALSWVRPCTRPGTLPAE